MTDLQRFFCQNLINFNTVTVGFTLEFKVATILADLDEKSIEKSFSVGFHCEETCSLRHTFLLFFFCNLKFSIDLTTNI